MRLFVFVSTALVPAISATISWCRTSSRAILAGCLVLIVSVWGLSVCDARAQAMTPAPSGPSPVLQPPPNATQVYIYGDPATLEGTFQSSLTSPYGPDPQGWTSVDLTDPLPHAGDFAKLIQGFSDIDPLPPHDNDTPQWSFLDDGTPPNNDPASTGGSVSAVWSYGIPGGWVTNYTGGVSAGLESLYDEVWSPDIDWDLPGPGDDGMGQTGILAFDTWEHLPYENGIFRYWKIRSFDGSTWTTWRNHGFAYFNEKPTYQHVEVDVSSLLVDGVQKVQIALGVIDMATALGLPGNDATPAPTYDNVSFRKYQSAGPVLVADEADLFHDGFPTNGTLTGSVRVDAGRDTGPAGIIVPQDEAIVSATSGFPGALVSSVDMHWCLLANPAFATQRNAALTSTGASALGNDCRGWTLYEGTVAGSALGNGQYAFDLPDGDPVPGGGGTAENPLLFPGDKLHYYFEAEDSGGRIVTLPADLTGFPDFPECGLSAYDLTFTVDALPGTNDQGELTSTILVWNDSGHRGAENELLTGFANISYTEGIDFDVYTTNAPARGLSNGLGSAGAHGATIGQIDGYDKALYLANDQDRWLISDGSEANGNDKSNDVDLLQQWNDQLADRYIVYFADHLASFLENVGGFSATYLHDTMGVTFVSDDIRASISNQTYPKVQAVPGSPVFLTSLGACGLVPPPTFDEVAPGASAVVSHEFLNPSAVPYSPSEPAAVLYEYMDGSGNFKTSLSFVVGFESVCNPVFKAPPGASARAELLEEIMNLFGASPTGPYLTPTPPARTVALDVEAHPNPFNPTVEIRLRVPAAGPVRAVVYSLRGQKVRTLLDEALPAGARTITWNGRDEAGVSVASGTYVLRVDAGRDHVQRKLALIQ